mgnify:CR=1 FL=1
MKTTHFPEKRFRYHTALHAHATGGETIFTPGWEPPLIPVFQPVLPTATKERGSLVPVDVTNRD